MSSSEHVNASSMPRHYKELDSRFGKTRIWIKDLDKLTTSPYELAWLSASERARAGRLKDPTESLRLPASHVFTRKVLSSLGGVHPSRIEILADECGRPRLAQSPRNGSSSAPCEFSVSRSENVLCIAVGQDSDIGVDIEVVRPDIDVLSISKTSFDPEDLAIIKRSSLEERLLTFYQLWTKKEAFAKMQGHGICSDHVKPMRADSWQNQILDFTVGDRRVMGSLAVCSRAHSRVSG